MSDAAVCAGAEEVLERYAATVFAAAYAMVKNKEDAEDIAQEVFISYVKAKPAFESAEHEKAWLLRVTINRCKSFFRSAWQRKTTGLEDDFPDTPFTPDETAVVEAVNRLPKKYRQVIYLYYIEGYATGEIAAILEMPQNTVLSQLASALWVIGFLTGKKTLYRLELRRMRLRLRLVWEIVSLGAAGFIMSFTTSAVQVVCNAMLAQFGGDLFVGVMTVINSIREVTYAPVSGITNAANPVMGFNYGAQAYRRVRTAIRFVSLVCVGYMTVVWLLLMLFPRFFIGIFNDDPTLVEACADSMFIYFFGCFMMSLQMAGQAAAQALGRSKQAIFFSLLRKVVIVIPLTLILPQIPGVGVHGVFLAEAISNFLGGGACFITMLCTIWRELKQKEKTAQAR